MKLIASVTALNLSSKINVREMMAQPGKNIEGIVATTGISEISRASASASLTSIYLHLSGIATRHDIPAPTHVITCTQAPDRHMPTPSLELINQIPEWKSCFFADLQTGCTGFVDCAYLANAFLALLPSACIYCFTGDLSSRMTDPTDHATECVFGDAINLSVFKSDDRTGQSSGDLGSAHFSPLVDQRFANAIYRDNDSPMIMNGLKVLNFVLQSTIPCLLNFISELQSRASLSEYSLVLHQANKFIVERINTKIMQSFPDLRVHHFSLGSIGNSSSSTIPIALSQERSAGRLRENVIICGFGVGMATHVGTIRIADNMLVETCDLLGKINVNT